MSDPTCYGSLQVCALRVAVLGSNGAPTPGPSNGYVSEALITFDVGVEQSKDIDLEKENGCGAICQTYFKNGTIKRATLGAALCELDLQLASMLVGGSLYATDTDIPVGWQLPFVNEAASNGVCLELWTRAWDSSEQATPAALSNQAAWWHWVFPRARFTLDNMKLEADFLEFAVKGNGQENSNMSHLGPFQDWPSYVADGGGVTAVGAIFLDDTIPTAECGFIEVPAQAS